MIGLALFCAWRQRILGEADLGVLDPAEYVRRDKLRKLPRDHTDKGGTPISLVHQDVRDAEAAVDRFGMATLIERAFASEPGPSSRLRTRAMLVAIVLGAMRGRSYSVADICSVLAGLPPDAAVRLNVQPQHRLANPISYSTVRKQLEKLEKLLAAGFAVDGVCHGVAWFVECLVLAPVPPEVLEALTAIAVDSTDLATWAASKDFRKEKNVKKRKGTHPDASADDQDASGVHDDGINAETLRRAAADPLVKHRLDSLVSSDLDEPDLKQQLPRGAVFGTQIGDFGPDNRLIRSRDPDARPGHKSAKGKSVAGFFLGYDLHLAVAVKGFRYHGDRAEATLGPEVLPFIVGISLKAAATNPAIAGLEAVATARSVAPLIREVLADRAYTNKATAFNRALHEMGIDVVMDHNKPEVQRDKLAAIAGKHQVRFHCGTCLHPSTPASMRTPPANLTGEALADWYTMRNRFYRYSVTQSYPDGRKRMKCPVHDQRIKTAATANTNHRDVPLMPTPKGSNICCSGHVTMTLESLDKHQDTPYGTHAWLMSYARRNQVENVNKELRRTSGLDDESCVKFGYVAHAIASAAASCAHNIRQARKYREQAAQPNAAHDNTATGTHEKTTTSAAEPRSAKPLNALELHDTFLHDSTETTSDDERADDAATGDQVPP